MKSIWKQLYLRELEKLRHEISQYQDDEQLWVILPGTNNSGGNLALHLCGNLRHFIGYILGGTGYIRNRDLEFSDSGKSREELTGIIQNCINEISATFDSAAHIEAPLPYPAEFLGENPNMGFVLTHLLAHFTYHLGQINYHRRYVSVNGR
jgi:uncharacterized damage-inducible protein DinB